MIGHDRELTAEEVRAAAARNGLELTEQEAARLVKGASRGRRLAEEVRASAGPQDVEPAGVFHAGGSHGR